MNVKEAVTKAKSFLSSVFSDEDIAELRLEEVEFDRREDAWLITLGVMRPSFSTPAHLSEIMQSAPLKRTYKVVRIPENENDYPSIKIREMGGE